MDLDLRLMRSFVVLVEEGHFGRAARRLHLTTSALTKRVMRLEREIGVSLIDRAPGGTFRVTVEGSRFADAAVPLLRHADIVRSRVRSRSDPDPHRIRIGFPAGSLKSFSTRMPLALMAGHIRQSYPEAVLTCHEVNFEELTTSLLDRRIDVLCTTAAVRSAWVVSAPLQASVGLVGLVPTGHPLAEAGSVDAATFADQPMLCNPLAPEEWMEPFWLADIRSRHDARLVETYGAGHGSTTRDAVRRRTVMTTVAMDAEGCAAPGQHVVELVGAGRMWLHTAHRRSDRRGAVHAVIAEFARLPPGLCA